MASGKKSANIPAEEGTLEVVLRLAELYPDAVRLKGTIPGLRAAMGSGPSRGRPILYSASEWPKVRAKAVARIRRQSPPDNFPSRQRIAKMLNIGERTVFNYDKRSES